MLTACLMTSFDQFNSFNAIRSVNARFLSLRLGGLELNPDHIK